MADIEARREARRRKILENSERRLHKITGVEQKSTKTELDGVRNIPNIDNESCTTQHIAQNTNSDRYQIRPSLSYTSEHETTSPNVILDNSVLFKSQTANIVSQKCRYLHIFLLPVILSIALALCARLQVDVRLVYLDKIFIPLLIYEIIEYITNSSTESSQNVLTSLLLLTNVNNRFVSVYISYINYFVKCMQDLMIYFFVFALSHAILSFLIL